MSKSTLSFASGKIDYTLTNDYMFRMLLQENEYVLRGLLCSLLHLKETEIKTVRITNTIELGKSIDNKTFVLDIKIEFNNSSIINLEMQVVNEANWVNRSLSYLCRTYDNLAVSTNYSDVKGAIHIGFLNYTLFPEHPEFYATYKLLNVKDSHLYTDNFMLGVVNLSQIDLATEEDKQWKIDHWAKLFAAKTWEDIRMLAKKNDYIKSASDTLYKLNQDETIREQCARREEYIRTMEYYEQTIATQNNTIEEQNLTIAEKDNALAEKDSTIAEKDNTILQMTNQYDDLYTWALAHGYPHN